MHEHVAVCVEGRGAAREALERAYRGLAHRRGSDPVRVVPAVPGGLVPPERLAHARGLDELEAAAMRLGVRDRRLEGRLAAKPAASSGGSNSGGSTGSRQVAHIKTAWACCRGGASPSSSLVRLKLRDRVSHLVVHRHLLLERSDRLLGQTARRPCTVLLHDNRASCPNRGAAARSLARSLHALFDCKGRGAALCSLSGSNRNRN